MKKNESETFNPCNECMAILAECEICDYQILKNRWIEIAEHIECLLNWYKEKNNGANPKEILKTIQDLYNDR